MGPANPLRLGHVLLLGGILVNYRIDGAPGEIRIYSLDGSLHNQHAGVILAAVGLVMFSLRQKRLNKYFVPEATQ
jgi:hypothetical protein